MDVLRPTRRSVWTEEIGRRGRSERIWKAARDFAVDSLGP